MYELRLESLRRPPLAAALDRLMGGTEEAVAAHHARLGLGMPAGAVPLMMVMYGGALFALVTAPPGSVTAEPVRPLAEHIVFGALHAADPKAAGAARWTWAT